MSAATPIPDVTSTGPVVDPLVTTGVGQLVADLYIPGLLLVGGLILTVAWLPLFIRKLPLSLPMFCVALGFALFTLTPLGAYSPHPQDTPLLIEKATELIVIVSLMGAGLKIDRAFTWADWGMTTRLLVIAMPISIGLVMWGGWALMGMPLAAALLFGAALAPTDPVLASDVQIEGTSSESNEEARFTLTSEAGLNDALAFPFIHLAIAAATMGFTAQVWTDWLLTDVLWKLGMGFVAGAVLGVGLGWIIYHLPRGTRLSRTGDGFVALGVTLLVYALTELVHGYGFLAVFVAGLALRRAARNHAFNDRMHDFADELERMLMLALLLLFGGMIAGGELFETLGWEEVVFALAIILIVRPVAGWISLLGVARPGLEKFIIAVFGIRGLGSVYYLAYGLNHADFPGSERLWNLLALVVLLSIVLHGLAVTPLMRRLDRQAAWAAKRADKADKADKATETASASARPAA